ncbi:hypothetical protein AB6A40_008994 [Gnathostoma spinigerum]|uniref:Uncharacterized protein n=1 Tax=Gnathostoma spinigerum TaxID=75299 RepID=A0ABD6ERW2_9BILA
MALFSMRELVNHQTTRAFYPNTREYPSASIVCGFRQWSLVSGAKQLVYPSTFTCKSLRRNFSATVSSDFSSIPDCIGQHQYKVCARFTRQTETNFQLSTSRLKVIIFIGSKNV